MDDYNNKAVIDTAAMLVMLEHFSLPAIQSFLGTLVEQMEEFEMNKDEPIAGVYKMTKQDGEKINAHISCIMLSKVDVLYVSDFRVFPEDEIPDDIMDEINESKAAGLKVLFPQQPLKNKENE